MIRSLSLENKNVTKFNQQELILFSKIRVVFYLNSKLQSYTLSAEDDLRLMLVLLLLIENTHTERLVGKTCCLMITMIY